MIIFLSYFSLNKKGFSLIEVMMAAAMMTVAGVSIIALSQIANQDSVQLRATRISHAARSLIEAALKNPMSWRQTVTKNSSFNCASMPAGCNVSSVNAGYYDFVLYGTADGEKVSFDSTDPTTRYSINGGACPAGTANPDPECPLKFIARWKPLCQTYPCQNPVLDVKVMLESEFGDSPTPLNVAKFEYATVRGLDDGSLQSACLVLNGKYNALTGKCYPKNAGKSCAAMGKPAQIITSVATDGNITCAPLYTGQCNPLTQVMNGISSAGAAQCVGRVQPPNCPVDCVGSWGACSAACGGGTQVYGIITPAANGGAACTSPAPGNTQACNTNPCPVDCVGSWGACSQPCGGGLMTYSITTPAVGGGAVCPSAAGDTQVCNSQACAVPVNCAGSWSTCNQITGTTTFTITQAPQDGGTACPSPLTKTCPVDCVGSWGACAGGPPQYKTYNWTTLPLNGGSTASCTYPNGQTDVNACMTCFNVLIMSNIRTDPDFLVYVNMSSGEVREKALVFNTLGPPYGPGTCRTSYYVVTCKPDGSISSIPDNTKGEPGGCPGCAANTLNDCY